MSPTGGPAYFILLGGAAAAVFLLARRFRPAALLVASLCFVLAFPEAGLTILPSLAVAYVSGLALERLRPGLARRSALALAVALLLLPLFLHRLRDSPLPLGLSFYTLQLIGYLADVHLNRSSAERSPWIFALFGSFFPLLPSGPIERSRHLLKQLRELPDFDYDRVRSGAWSIFVGLFKKIVLADALAPGVKAVFSSPAGFTGGEVLAGTALARYELFFELSGYTDIALGSAAILGVTLTQNFNRPFAANSLLEFWRRWHISLFSWFHDYVYLPLSAKAGRAFALTFAFALLGAWQGFGWNFLAFGALQGALILLQETAKGGALARVPATLRRIWTFAALICLPMVLLKTRDLGTAGAALGRILVPAAGEPRSWADLSGLAAAFPASWLPLAVLIPLFEILQLLHARRPIDAWLGERPTALRWAIYLLAALCFVAFGRFGKPADYAYRSF